MIEGASIAITKVRKEGKERKRLLGVCI